jgi:hypothetical protein
MGHPHSIICLTSSLHLFSELVLILILIRSKLLLNPIGGPTAFFDSFQVSRRFADRQRREQSFGGTFCWAGRG